MVLLQVKCLTTGTFSHFSYVVENSKTPTTVQSTLNHIVKTRILHFLGAG